MRDGGIPGPQDIAPHVVEKVQFKIDLVVEKLSFHSDVGVSGHFPGDVFVWNAGFEERLCLGVADDIGPEAEGSQVLVGRNLIIPQLPPRTPYFKEIHGRDGVFEEIFLRNYPTRQEAGKKAVTGFLGKNVGTVVAPEKFSQVFFFVVIGHPPEVVQTRPLEGPTRVISLEITPGKYLINGRRKKVPPEGTEIFSINRLPVDTGQHRQAMVAKLLLVIQDTTQQDVQLVVSTLVQLGFRRAARAGHEFRRYAISLESGPALVQCPGYLPGLGVSQKFVNRRVGRKFQPLNARNLDVQLGIALQIIPSVNKVAGLVGGDNHGVLPVFNVRAGPSVGPEGGLVRFAAHLHPENGTG